MLITLDHAYMSNEIHSFIESEIVVVVQFTTQFLLCSSFVCQFNLGSWIIKVPSYTHNMYLAMRVVVSNKTKFGLFIARIRNCNRKLHLVNDDDEVSIFKTHMEIFSSFLFIH